MTFDRQVLRVNLLFHSLEKFNIYFVTLVCNHIDISMCIYVTLYLMSYFKMSFEIIYLDEVKNHEHDIRNVRNILSTYFFT